MNDSYNIREDGGNVTVCLELVNREVNQTIIDGVIIALLVNTNLSKFLPTCHNH